MYGLVALAFVLGFAAGLLFGRRNKNKVEKAYKEANEAYNDLVEKLARRAKKKSKTDEIEYGV